MARKKIIAVTYSPEKSVWQSCQDLAKNLRTAYQIAFGSSVEFIPSLNPGNALEFKRTAKELLKMSPDVIAFTEPGPNPGQVLCYYDAILEAGKTASQTRKAIFHLYGGGLFLDMPYWQKSEIILKKYKCKFSFSSERQHSLVAPFFLNQKDVSNCAFPISSESFFYSAETRQKFRSRFGLTKKDKLFVYTGRLSATKNIIVLLRNFATYASMNPDAYLFLAGPFDDISLTVFTYLEKRGDYEKRVLKVLADIKHAVGNRIRLLGVLSTDEILSLNNGADAFISLGTYHNEEFGLSPLVGLGCGCPVVLGAWGGFSQSSGDGRDCMLVSVGFTSQGLACSSSDISKAFNRIGQNQEDDQIRMDRSQRFIKRYSPDAIAEKLIELHEVRSKFRGFSKTSDLFMKGPNLAYPMEFLRDGEYRAMYQRYVSASSNTLSSEKNHDLAFRTDWIGERIVFKSRKQFFKEIRDRHEHCFDER